MAEIEQVKNIFLSARIPIAERNAVYFETADENAIRDAVMALASVVLTRPEFHLIWGGQPAIMPLMEVVRGKKRVTLYQSDYFHDKFPLENEDMGIRVITPRLETRESSLRLMREKMICDNKYEAAFFIGGMEGVEDEYRLFTETYPGVPAYPIASTGGAARIIYDGMKEKDVRLLEDLTYGSLFRELLGIETPLQPFVAQPMDDMSGRYAIAKYDVEKREYILLKGQFFGTLEEARAYARVLNKENKEG